MEQIEFLLDCLAILLLSAGICQEKVTKAKKKWLLSGCLGLGILILPIFCREGIETFPASFFMVSIICLILIEENWRKKIVIYLFSLFYLQGLYMPIRLMIRIIGLLCNKPLRTPKILESLLVILCVLFFAYQIRKRADWVKWIKKVPLQYYIFGLVCAFSASGITAYIDMLIVSSSRKTQMLITILVTVTNTFIYAIGIGAAFIDLFRLHYKEENILKDKYLQLSKLHYESLMKNMEEVRGLRHDMKAHLNAVSYFIENRDWEKLERYIEEAKGESVKGQKNFININHDLINAILAETLGNKPDIVFQYEGSLPEKIKVEDFDLCTIFSNLVSNSIEACDKLDYGKKEIILQIKRFQNNLCIYMENPVQDEIKMKELGKWTTKQDKVNHGYGIQNIISAVEKYDGEISFQCENHRFSVEIIFYDII